MTTPTPTSEREAVVRPNLYPGISRPLENAKLRCLSLGGGVESTTLLLMAAAGEVGPMLDIAWWADTDDETEEAYNQIRWVSSPNMGVPFPVERVSAGSIADDFDAVTSGRQRRMPNPPLFVKNPNGKRGQIVRGCTRDYKIKPVERAIKKWLGLSPRARRPKSPIVELWLGIAADDLGRVVQSLQPHIYNRYPLVEIGFTREDCLRWTYERFGVRLEASGCIRCPFRDNEEWLRIQRTDPAAFAIAVEADKAARHYPGLHGPAFLHDSLRPLGEIDFVAEVAKRRGDLDSHWMTECAGRCRV